MQNIQSITKLEEENKNLKTINAKLLEALEDIMELAHGNLVSMRAELKIYPHGDIQQPDIDDAEIIYRNAEAAISAAKGK